MRTGNIVAKDVWVLLMRSERDIATSWVHKQLHWYYARIPKVYTELVSLMLSGYDIDTSRFRLVRSEQYIATAWHFYKKKSL